MKVLYGLIGFAAVGWFILFSPWTAGLVNFWAGMSAAAGILAVVSLWFASLEPPPLWGGTAWTMREAFAFRYSHIVVGFAAAALLYIIFLIGDRISALLFNFARPQVAGIYSIKTQSSPALIGALLFLLIGPAEEFFWRGCVQRKLSARLGGQRGLVVSTILYTSIHIWSLNLMLVMAALVCGLFWGLMYKSYRSVWPGVISHSVWDAAIFILAPV